MILKKINGSTYKPLSFPEQVGGFTLYFDDGWKYSSQGYIEKNKKKYKANDKKAIELINNYVNTLYN